MAHTTDAGAALARDGASLHYTIHGGNRPDVPRIALVHSLGMTGAVWDAVVERLVETACVLTYDCRGHGASSKTPGPYRLETFANDLADLLTHVGWSGAHVAGASLGGNVALQFAILYGPRTQSLGLIDTTAWYGADAPEKWEWRAREAEEKGLASLIEFQLSRWFSDSFRQQGAPGVALCRALFLANDVAGFAASCRMLGAFDLRPHLASLRVPAAIIVGEEDPATPLEMARVLESGIPGATLQVIPKLRHLTFVERPDVIAGFLSRLVASRPATVPA